MEPLQSLKGFTVVEIRYVTRLIPSGTIIVIIIELTAGKAMAARTTRSGRCQPGAR